MTGGRTVTGAGPITAGGTWRFSTGPTRSAMWSVPWCCPSRGMPRIEILTRLRRDSRLYELPPRGRRAGHADRAAVGQTIVATQSGGPLAGKVADGQGFIYGRQRQVRWKEVVCLWESGLARGRQSGGRRGGGLSASGSPGEVGHEPERPADRGVVHGPFPTRRRVPGPEAASGVGRMPSLDPGPDRADHPGPVGDHEPVADVSIPLAGRGSTDWWLHPPGIK